MIFASVLAIIILLLLGLASYCFVKDQSRSIIPCMFDRFIIFGKKKKDDDDGVPGTKDTPDANKTCAFEGEDLYNSMVFTKDGQTVKEQPQMTCSDCKKYIYKDNEGKCYDFIHDVKYNADNYCLQEQEEERSEGGGKIITQCNDICTASFTPRTCPD